jgi:hypothetical protein
VPHIRQHIIAASLIGHGLGLVERTRELPGHTGGSESSRPSRSRKLDVGVDGGEKHGQTRQKRTSAWVNAMPFTRDE